MFASKKGTQRNHSFMSEEGNLLSKHLHIMTLSVDTKWMLEARKENNL